MDSAHRALLERYAELLATAPLNLIAKGDRADVWGRHIAEAVRVVEALEPLDGERWLDLGTGGGLPGIVLAVLRPGVEVILLDARGKKIRAVQGFVADLGLSNAVTMVGRAEHVARDALHRGRYDGVVSRAVARLEVVAELSRGLVGPDGRVAMVRGADAADELTVARPVLQDLGLGEAQCLGIPGTPRVTNLVTMRAHGPAAAWVPRADGVPQSCPLGGTPPAE